MLYGPETNLQRCISVPWKNTNNRPASSSPHRDTPNLLHSNSPSTTTKLAKWAQHPKTLSSPTTLPKLRQHRLLPLSPFLILLLHCSGKHSVKMELIGDLSKTAHPSAAPSHSNTETSNLKLWRQGDSGGGVPWEISELLPRISIQQIFSNISEGLNIHFISSSYMHMISTRYPRLIKKKPILLQYNC
jgi:hypothetical protein